MTATLGHSAPVKPRRGPPVSTASGAAGRFRRQPPVYSPLSAQAVFQAALAAVRASRDPRRELRDALRWSYQSQAGVLTGSGTQALQLAITAAARLVGAAAPVHVALPAFTCFNVATAAVGAGARIALYDVDPWTLSPDLDSLEAVLARGARVVVVTPLYGFPVDWSPVESRAAHWGAVVVEDAAQGQGARWCGRPLGALGSLSVLSFGRGKGWTGGGGGALLLRRNARRETLVTLRPGKVSADLGTVASAVGQWLLGRPSLYAIPAALPFLALGETRYHDPEPLREMSRAAAAVALRTRSEAVLEALARQANGAALIAQLPATVAAVRVLPNADPSFIRLPVRIPGGLAGLPDPEWAMRLGIGRTYPSTLAELEPVRARMAGTTGRWPGADALVKDLVTLPTHSQLTPRDRSALLAALRR